MKIYATLVQSNKQKNALDAEGNPISASLAVIAGKANFKSRNSVTLTNQLRPLVGQQGLFEVSERQVTYDSATRGTVTEWQLQVTPITNESLVNRIIGSADFPIENEVKFASASVNTTHDSVDEDEEVVVPSGRKK